MPRFHGILCRTYQSWVSKKVDTSLMMDSFIPGSNTTYENQCPQVKGGEDTYVVLGVLAHNLPETLLLRPTCHVFGVSLVDAAEGDFFIAPGVR